jgi:aminoglycoside phosphotransferase (APT) family kinase protein
MRIGDPRSVVAALKAVLPELAMEADPTPLSKGYGSEAWLATTDAGTVLLKIALRWPDGARLPNAATAARLAAGQGVSTPQALAVAVTSTYFDGHAYSVWEYLEGTDVEEALATMDEAEVVAFFARLGGLLGLLHGLVGPHYARSVLEPQGASRWAEWVTKERLERLEERYGWAGLDLDGTVQEAARRIATSVSTLDRARGTPVLIHGDVYTDNLLLSPEGAPILLDFELARYADLGIEFAKPTLFLFSRHPAGRTPLLDAYRKESQATELELRTHVALGLELVWGIPFFHHWGDLDALAIYRGGLAEWLEVPA